MATHRRGLRPAQWPVRDLLGEQRSRMGGLRDPRLYAAVGGLLACGAAATVAFTASDGGQGRAAGPGPMALPMPNTVLPAPVDPAPSGPDPSDPGSGSGSAGSDPAGSGSSGGAPSGPAPSGAGGGSAGAAGSGPVPRAWRLPEQEAPAPADAPPPAASASVREIADRLAAELERLRTTPAADGTVDALLVVPQQRGGDLTALVKRVRTDPSGVTSPQRAGGRHRAPEAAAAGHRAQAADERDRDDDRRRDRDEHVRHEDRERDRHERDRDEDRERDRDHRDRGHHGDRGHHHGDRDRGHHGDRDHDRDGDRHHASVDDAGDCDEASDGDRHGDARAARAAAGRPAMAVIGASSHGDRGERLGGRTIESDAVLAALADLDHPTPFPGWFDA